MTYMFNQTHYYFRTYLRNLETHVSKIYELDPVNFLSAPGLAWQAYLKKTGVEL